LITALKNRIEHAFAVIEPWSVLQTRRYNVLDCPWWREAALDLLRLALYSGRSRVRVLEATVNPT
jgi:hypothetical protein